MSESPDEQSPARDGPEPPPESDRDDTPADDSGGDADVEALRERVEEKYDFEEFGPADMAEMTAEEWDVAFDQDSWIVGEALLDRVHEDLLARVATRDVFAAVEEVSEDGDRRLLAYSDEGYAVVYPDGSVAGFGTVLRDVKPVVALCSMDSYDPREAPAEGVALPDPEEVPEGGGEFGNLMLQAVAGAQLLAGLGLAGAWLVGDLPVTAVAAAVFFVLIAVFLFGTVANARLSDRFRSEEYRERLRAVGADSGEYPEFVPVEDGRLLDPAEADREAAIPEADGEG
jgi:hypothetical protein